MNIVMLLKPKATIEYIFEDNTARQVLEKMRSHGFSAVPVIDRQGRFVKTLSEGDFLRFMMDKGMYDIREMEKYSIGEIPSKVKMKPVSVSSPMQELILLSMDQNFVPVTDDRESFIGIVTRKDILRYCYDTIGKYRSGQGQETAACENMEGMS